MKQMSPSATQPRGRKCTKADRMWFPQRPASVQSRLQKGWTAATPGSPRSSARTAAAALTIVSATCPGASRLCRTQVRRAAALGVLGTWRCDFRARWPHRPWPGQDTRHLVCLLGKVSGQVRTAGGQAVKHQAEGAPLKTALARRASEGCGELR